MGTFEDGLAGIAEDALAVRATKAAAQKLDKLGENLTPEQQRLMKKVGTEQMDELRNSKAVQDMKDQLNDTLATNAAEMLNGQMPEPLHNIAGSLPAVNLGALAAHMPSVASVEAATENLPSMPFAPNPF